MADKEPQEMKAAPPEMIPMPGPEENKGGEGYIPPPPNPQEDLEFVAALAASTQSQVGQIAENIIGESTNLKPEKFDAHAMVKQHLNNTGIPVNPPQPQPTQLQVSQQPMQIQPQQPTQMPPPSPVQPVQPLQPVYDEGQMLRRLLALEDKLDRLQTMGDKILKSLLKKNTKQITIRFDDVKDTK